MAAAGTTLSFGGTQVLDAEVPMRKRGSVLVQRLLRCTDGAENGLYSRIIPHFCGIKPELFLENLMPPCFSEFPSVDASTLFRRFATIENCSKSARIP
jgi:hypothetical protein